MFPRFSHPCNWIRALNIINSDSTILHLRNRETRYTRLIRHCDRSRAAFCPVLPLTPEQSQSEPASSSESYMWVTFTAAVMVKSCHSTLFRAILIRAGIVRDHVRDLVTDHVRAALLRATLVRATPVSANLLSNIIYSIIQQTKDLLDLESNHGGSETEVG